MSAESIKFYADIFNPVRLFGPIFDKELRVSSRRRRNYYLRTAYVALLMAFLLLIWFSIVGFSNSDSAIYQVSRLPKIGRQVIISIVWLQLIISQILAIIMLSSSISDEIRTGTLNVLMTTPINSFQIVTGKLLSKLLQLLLLLAMSFPLLAIIRVFGGIPWYYIVSSFFITLTAVIFAGSLSLFLSIFYRYAYRVIIVILVGYLLIFGILPVLFVGLAGFIGHNQNNIHSIFAVINPFWAMAAATQKLSTPSIGIFSWPKHCLIMLSTSVVFLSISIWRVRYAGFGISFTKHSKLESRKVIKDEKGKEIAHYYEYPGHIKRVRGNPIVWKEMYKGFFGKSKIDKLVYFSLICLSFISVIIFLFTSRNTPTMIIGNYTMMFMYLIIMIRLAIATAGSIAHEKEARTLPILLTTPLEDKDIILDKVKAGIWRNIPLLILYLLFLFIFYIFHISIGFLQLLFHIPLSILSIASAVLFIVGCGSYFGVRMKNSTIAIAATIGCYFVIYYLFINIIRMLVIIPISRFIRNAGFISLFSISTTFFTIIISGGIGLYFLRRSIRRLRHNIF